jgi:hypothetical protein
VPHSKKLDGHTLGLNGGDGRVVSVVAVVVVVVVVTVVEVKMEVIIVVPTIGVSKGTETETERGEVTVMVTKVCEEERWGVEEPWSY